MQIVLALASIVLLMLWWRQSRQSFTTSSVEGNWRVVDLNGEQPPQALKMSFQSQGKALLVSGNSGCNRYSGSVEITETGLRFGPLASTRRACIPPINAFETRFLNALAEVRAFRIENNQLELLDGSDALITLEK